MSVNILLITHPNIGESLLDAVKITFGQLPLKAHAFAIDYNEDPDQLLPKLRNLSTQLNDGDGILILTDLFGSTPYHLAQKLQDEKHIFLVTGLNLPMLIRVMNYPTLNLLQLAQKALSGGKDGVICNATEKSHDH